VHTFTNEPGPRSYQESREKRTLISISISLSVHSLVGLDWTVVSIANLDSIAAFHSPDLLLKDGPADVVHHQVSAPEFCEEFSLVVREFLQIGGPMVCHPVRVVSSIVPV